MYVIQNELLNLVKSYLKLKCPKVEQSDTGSTLSLDFKGGNSKTYSQCEKCKIVVDSFKEGLKRTARGKHEGGDAHWEEKKLSNYANSEIRLTEIQENLCHEVSLGKDQCHSFAEEFESALEEWFFQHLKKERVDQIDEGSSLFDHLCNDVASACCPEGHYGPSCTPCQGYPEQVCNGRGYCAGNGTREGKGNCKCFRGYGGKQCEKCAKSYFDAEATESSGDSANQIPKICQRCDRSCASSCHSSGPRGCHVCGKGYTWDQETGCIDVNECSELEVNPCTESTYCSNTVGSFKCLRKCLTDFVGHCRKKNATRHAKDALDQEITCALNAQKTLS
ncbi:PREDICTED: cysteine-rich with EGF-like domain protein 2 [Rhagoletis zephyria]|uniref:cysteine-rich with EGF-like domain protein 2 n=1 Tax=Rhagoletis zephyria TaxID=28612 RepID=UPI0008117CC8|nr:PREDICTED: cysteine-rich with EGF-like domain protein 2 [Rhagoletis zephyria]